MRLSTAAWLKPWLLHQPHRFLGRNWMADRRRHLAQPLSVVPVRVRVCVRVRAPERPSVHACFCMYEYRNSIIRI